MPLHVKVVDTGWKMDRTEELVCPWVQVIDHGSFPGWGLDEPDQFARLTRVKIQGISARN